MKRTLCLLGLLLLAIPLTHAQISLRKSCPLKILRATGIGPLNFQSTLPSIQSLFPDAKVSRANTSQIIDVAGLKMSFCADKPVEIYFDFAELKDDCVEFQGHKLTARTPVKKARRWMGGCTGVETRGGVTFYDCGQGLKIGTLDGAFTQVRLNSGQKTNCPVL